MLARHRFSSKKYPADGAEILLFQKHQVMATDYQERRSRIPVFLLSPVVTIPQSNSMIYLRVANILSAPSDKMGKKILRIPDYPSCRSFKHPPMILSPMIPRSEQTSHDSQLGVRTILVVDDDPLVVRAMSILMTRAGFRAIMCKTAADALKKADNYISAAVVDIHLPDMSGLALSQQLRQRLGPDVPIVILSADNSIETIRALPDAGATTFFAKPVNAARLIDHLNEWLDIEKTS